MAPAQLAAQSVSSLSGGTGSGIKRIVSHWSSAPDIDLPRSEPEAELLLPEEKIQLEENTAPRLYDLFIGVIQRIGRKLPTSRQLSRKYVQPSALIAGNRRNR